VPGQQLRSMKEYIEAVRKIREGIIGDVIMVKAQRHATADLPYDGTSGDWYFDVNRSGGYLIEQSVHNLDLCNWAIGAHPTRACGFGGILLYKNSPPGRTIFDCGTISYDYPGGVKMSFTQNVFHPRGLPNGNQYIYVYDYASMWIGSRHQRSPAPRLPVVGLCTRNPAHLSAAHCDG
jgi:predicted dehydrogenase